MLLKPGTGNREPGTTGSGERGTEVWERAVSSVPHKNSKWRTRKLSGREKNYRDSKIYGKSHLIRFKKSLES